MKEGYIIVDLHGKSTVSISTKTKEFLENVKPKGCPFLDYSMFNLLEDWIKMYSWQMERNKKIPLIEFIRQIVTDGKYIYKDAMIRSLEM